MQLKNIQNKVGFIEGGGEMGELIRDFDWETTAIGRPEDWPLTLKAALGIVLHSAFPMFLFWGEDLLCFYNDAYRPSLGIDGKHPMIGKKAKEGWPEIWDFIGPIIQDVMKTGVATWYEDQLLPIYRNGKMEDVYWTFSYSPAYGDTGEVTGVFVTCTETTGKVKAIKTIKEEEAKFRALIEEAPVATCLLTGIEMRIEVANDSIIKHWGKGKDVIGKTVLEALPELKDQPFVKLLQDVFTTGKTYEANEAKAQLVLDGIIGTYYFHLTYKAVRNPSGEIYGVMCMSVDVTKQVLAKEALDESNDRLEFTIEAAELGTFNLNPQTNKFVGNARLKEWFGLTPEEEIELHLATDVIAAKDREKVNAAIVYALNPASGGTYDIEYTIIHPKTKKETVVKAKGKTLFDEDNKPYNFSGTLQDITEEIKIRKQLSLEAADQKIARQKAEESEAHLQLLRDTVPAMIFYLDEEQRYQSYNVVFMEWFNVNAEDAIGKTVLEFLGKEAYNKTIPYLDKAYAGEQARYEMHAPSRMKEDRWLSIVYTPHSNTEGKIIGIIVHATDITEQVVTRKKIEAAVAERTKELDESNLSLKRSNSELEQFAYIASHDLQEPIRKISTFTQLLENSISNINDQSKNYISKIYGSTDRMTNLIRDVLAFSQLSEETGSFEEIDLEGIVRAVEIDFELLIQQKQAFIEVNNLPKIKAIATQMTQLFSNLMSNSLKYTKPNVIPIIKISAAIADKEMVAGHSQLDQNKNYYHISFSDNGIGFDQEHADRIFKIFQRLHGKTEFEGTGIGLSICRKIVQTHKGHIAAEINENGGAVFNILLPDNN